MKSKAKQENPVQPQINKSKIKQIPPSDMASSKHNPLEIQPQSKKRDQPFDMPIPTQRKADKMNDPDFEDKKKE